MAAAWRSDLNDARINCTQIVQFETRLLNLDLYDVGSSPMNDTCHLLQFDMLEGISLGQS